MKKEKACLCTEKVNIKVPATRKPTALNQHPGSTEGFTTVRVKHPGGGGVRPGLQSCPNPGIQAKHFSSMNPGFLLQKSWGSEQIIPLGPSLGWGVTKSLLVGAPEIELLSLTSSEGQSSRHQATED